MQWSNSVHLTIKMFADLQNTEDCDEGVDDNNYDIKQWHSKGSSHANGSCDSS